MALPLVETSLGKYSGHFVETLGGRKVFAFNGIRYAKPPIHNLRFKEAEKVEAHNGIYDATSDGDDCVQENQSYNKYTVEEGKGKKHIGSEDCLFLNIYTPQIKPRKLYPVIVYIHGGGFYKGSGSINWHGPQMLLDKDVVLVTITYRLHVFGFLALDDLIQANLGLKDQSLALHWIKDHIACFGGDPDNITLTGNSAGAVCTELHMLSPKNKGIIRRAICQSGSIRCPWGLMTRKAAKENTLALATTLNCPPNPPEVLATLMEKSVDEIMTALRKTEEKNGSRLFFAPILEEQGGFITQEDVMAGTTIPLLVGVTRDEGFLYYRENVKKGDENLSYINKSYKQCFPTLMKYKGHSQKDEISEKIKHFYFGDDDISKESLTEYIKMTTDRLFVHGVLQHVKEHRGKSYMYLLTHQGARSLTNDLPTAGVCHGDDLMYLYPFSKTPIKINFNEEDSKVQKLLVELWTNFAAYGDPTPNKEALMWSESEQGMNYVSITSDGIKPSQHVFSSRMEFWDSLCINSVEQIFNIP